MFDHHPNYVDMGDILRCRSFSHLSEISIRSFGSNFSSIICSIFVSYCMYIFDLMRMIKHYNDLNLCI
ncbi:hypothetical protein RclHR1_07870001 [Rhizophagus clarus]|uniref:Uncharacterized protein n=1 Tax=Rhizophagus clarus TaxID=94130 RepID=A0A2Z6RY41_9GLOM|nr:hypothetical protein RclHR1_07870001 [Rhizophagus clarus]